MSWPRSTAQVDPAQCVDDAVAGRVVARRGPRRRRIGAVGSGRRHRALASSVLSPASRGASGQTPMWSGSRRGARGRSSSSASTWARGSCSRPARSRTANSSAIDLVVALVGERGAAQGLGRGPAVADGDRALDLLATQRVVGDDDDRRAELAVDAPQQRRRSRRWCRCRARRSARRPGALGRVGQRDRDRHALLLAAARAGPADDRPAPPGRPVPAARAPCAGAAARRTVEDHRQLDVLARREVGQQVARGLLPDEADPRAGRCVRSRRPMAVRSWPATMARPADGTSRPPRMFSSVDLPEPEAPTIAIISPGSTSRSRPWRATTSRSATL